MRKISNNNVQEYCTNSLCAFDRRIRHEGFPALAGVDEAGRGPWAGPVVAAIAVMPADAFMPEVNDSKKLTPAKREKAYEWILSSCTAYATGMVNHHTIDAINILNATHLAVKKALLKLTVPVDLFLVDGHIRVPCLSAQRCFVEGDSRSFVIACASIIAKVTRDRIMMNIDRCYPGWGFSRHKGYGTPEHREAIERRGVSLVHRRSFAPIKKISNMSPYRKSFGRTGEQNALFFLKKKGYTIAEVNWRCPRGELDIIAEKKGVIVFIEVKTRAGNDFADAAEAVNRKKQMKIANAAASFLKAHALYNRECRFDVITVTAGNIEHFENAFNTENLTI